MYRGVAAAGQRLKAEQAVVAGTPFRALHEHDHSSSRTAPRGRVLDLERLIAEGRGDIVSSAVIVQPSLIIVA